MRRLESHPEEERGQNTGKPLKKQYKIHQKIYIKITSM